MTIGGAGGRMLVSRPAEIWSRRAALRDPLYGYLFVMPQLVGFLVFIVGALATVFFFSLHDRNLLSGAFSFVGLENYTEMVSGDPLFSQVLLNSLVFTAGLVPLNVAVALGLALLLDRSLPGRGLFRGLFFAPVVTSAVAWAIVWRFMLQGEQGTVNQTLRLVGLEGPNWLREPAWAMTAVIVTRVLKNVGLNMIIFLAALQSLPRECLEAARVDGASGRHLIRYIVLPLLAPTTFFVTVITVIGSLQVFDHIVLMTEGGPANATMVLVYYVYYQGFRAFETGYASALAVVLFLVALGLTIVQWKLRSRDRDAA